MVPVVEVNPMIREADHAAPTVEPMSPSSKVVVKDLSRKIPIDGVPLEIALVTSVVGRFKEDPTEISQMKKAVVNPKEDLMMAMETERSLKTATTA